MRAGSIFSTLLATSLIGLAIAVTHSVHSAAQTETPAAPAIDVLPNSGAQAMQAEPASPATRAGVASNYGKLPISFEPNRGQTSSDVNFLARGSGYGISLTGREAVLTLHAPQPKVRKNSASQKATLTGDTLPVSFGATDVVRMRLRGADPGTHPDGADVLPGSANYFIGGDPSKWKTGIPTYARVRLPRVYPGIDLVYYGNQSQLEYDFVVAPDANPKSIRLSFAGARKLALTADGNLAVVARHGQIVFNKPVVYQENTGQRQPVEGRFALLANRTVGFSLGRYDHALPLVIDPVLSYSTYLSGSADNEANAIAVDNAGNAYVTGYTTSSDFPVVPGAMQPVNPAGDLGAAFVTKLNPTGTALLYSTFLGGSSETQALAIAVDSSGDAFIAGGTSAADFPTTLGAFQTNYGGNGNAFIAELDPTGSALIYSTYLGGSSGDTALGIAVDASGSAYVAGSTGSSDFPVTAGAFQTTNHALYTTDAFVTRLNPAGSALLYSTYLGGSDNPNYGPGDGANAIAIDALGNAYVAGNAWSDDFPVTPAAFQSKNRSPYGFNGFVSKLNPSGSSLVYSTYLGGSGTGFSLLGDQPNGIAVDSEGDAYVAGWTGSSNYPVTAGAFQSQNNASALGTINAFVTKLNATGSGLVYSTYLGGSGRGSLDCCPGYGDGANAVVVDGEGNAYVAGSAGSTNFPVTTGTFQPKSSGWASFLTKLNPAGSALLYSTYLAGTGLPRYLPQTSQTYGLVSEHVSGLAVDIAGNAYFAGTTAYNNFPITPGSFQTRATGQSGRAAYVGKLPLGSHVASLPPAGAPVFWPAPGKYIGSVTVTLSDATPGPTIYYSINGSKWSEYTGSITLTNYSTVQAFAAAIDHAPSGIVNASYSLIAQTPTPVISLTSGGKSPGQLIEIIDSDATATIRFTTDGSTPTMKSIFYHGPIPLTGSETIKAIAFSTNFAGSNVASATYSVSKP